MHAGWARGSGNRSKYMKFHLNSRKHFFCHADSQTLEKDAQKCYGVSIVGDIQVLSGQGLEQSALDDLA